MEGDGGRWKGMNPERAIPLHRLPSPSIPRVQANMDRTTNHTFAGRSARRRMYQGNQ